LIRRLCPACKQVANAGVPRSLIGCIPERSMIYIPVGCAECGMTGYSGRIAVTEVLVTTPEIERAIAGNEPPDRLVAAARDSGTRSLWGCGAAQLVAGNTSAQELVRVLEPEGARAGAYEPGTGYDLPKPIIYERRVKKSETKIVAGVVEVYVIRHNGGDWRVLALQRADDTKRPGSWETVYGKIDSGERPEDAAERELQEETGLDARALYNVTVNSFYLHAKHTIQMCIVFAAFVDDDAEVELGEEHQRSEWLSVDDACERYTWPREAHSLRDAQRLLASGDAGPAEDVLRII
jgi:8-oxo-dGTP pyrophosphatase MutT (NUDIX family)